MSSEIIEIILRALGSEPLLAITIIGVGYILIKVGKKLGSLLDNHMKKLLDKVNELTEKIERLNQSFAVQVIKTDYRIENLEKRIDKAENKIENLEKKSKP